MYKYRHFPIFFGLAAILLLLFLFPVSFDNNDDQYMFFISSGALSGSLTPNVILSNIIIGKLLNSLFAISAKVNWYTGCLQMIQSLCFGAIFLVFVHRKKATFAESFFFVAIIFMGLAALCFVKLQFTTVALFCCFAALLCLQSQIAEKWKYILAVVLLACSILIRKESFYIFLTFSIPVLSTNFRKKDLVIRFSFVVILATVFFLITNFINKQDSVYQKQRTYDYLGAMDIIAAKPAVGSEPLLKENNFTKDDIALLRSWFPGDAAYTSGEDILGLSQKMSSARNVGDTVTVLRKFIKDERYALLVLGISLLIVLLYRRKIYGVIVLNLLVAVMLIVFLAITSRIPHRVTFPVLSYLILLTIFLFIEDEKNKSNQWILICSLLALSSYKFFRVIKLYAINMHNHEVFESCQEEIQAHPGNLFVAVYDGLPVEYMNAWKTPAEFASIHNLLLTCWYAYSPDNKILLKNHQLQNLTADLQNRKDVLFLTDSEEFRDAYVAVMKQRYNLDCHFENAEGNFKVLHPTVLIFDH